MLKLDRNYSDYTDETDEEYPEGKAIDASSSESFDGTPLLASFMNDINGAHIAMYEKAFGSTDEVSGEPDTQKSSQFVDAIEKYVGDKDKNNFRFTYVVNSDESLAYWLSNKASGESSGGDDFTSVLIKAGEWSYDGNIVELDTIGTKAIEGEVGNNVNLTDGVKYTSLPEGTEYHIKGVNFIFAISSIGLTSKDCLKYCSNITDCNIKFSKSMYSIRGMDYCSNITNCNVIIENNDGYEGVCYDHCNNLTYCTGYVKAGSYGRCFYTCRNLVSCYIDKAFLVVEQQGFNGCERLVNCSIDIQQPTANASKGFLSCKFLNNCICTINKSNKATNIAFNLCKHVCDCNASVYMQEDYQALATARGFYLCEQLSNCEANVTVNSYVDGKGNRSGGECYLSCERLSNCQSSTLHTNGGANPVGSIADCKYVYNCYAISALKSEGLPNIFAMVECTYVLGCRTRKIVISGGSSDEGSYLNCFTDTGSNRCANTPTGGFNS